MAHILVGNNGYGSWEVEYIIHATKDVDLVKESRRFLENIKDDFTPYKERLQTASMSQGWVRFHKKDSPPSDGCYTRTEVKLNQVPDEDVWEHVSTYHLEKFLEHCVNTGLIESYEEPTQILD